MSVSRRLAGVFGVVVLWVCVFGVGSAFGAGAARWSITSFSSPTNFVPGGVEEVFVVTARNVGDAPADGAGFPIRVADVLPAGITLGEVSGLDQRTEAGLSCDQVAVSCSFEEPVLPGDALVLTVAVNVGEGTAPLVTNVASVSGGGATAASSSEQVVVGAAPAGFGISGSSVATDTSSLQAGAHADLTTTFALNQSSPDHPTGNIKNIEVDTPPGFVGNVTGIPACTMDEVNTATCPQDSAVGVVRAGVEFGPGLVIPFSAFVYNIKPYAGEPAALAFVLIGEIPVRLDLGVRSDGDYGIHASATGINDIKSVISTTLTLWGVPADHNGPGPFSFFDTSGEREVFYGGRGSGLRTAFLRNPTACGGVLPVGFATESWEALGFIAHAEGTLGPFVGCERLSFAPSLVVAPESSQAGAGTGYTVDLHVPQNLEADGLATPDLRTAVVSMPPGTVVSPSAANGLEGCSDAQFGLHSLAPASCPHASQVGTVKITTPLLAEPVLGQVFLGAPLCAPCGPTDAQDGSMVRLFIQAQGSGVIVKVQGSTSINQATGQLTTTFENNPQLPFEDLRLSLNGGPRAPLANPRACGEFSATSQLTPYSSETPATPSSAPFEVTGCGTGVFAPSFTAGTTTNQAGAFSPETVTFSRGDQDQPFGALTLHTPPGLLGMISKVALCPDANAATGTCPAASQIGVATTAAGPGSEPFYLPGQVFLTGPYKGAPYGLAVVVHALAGPYDLGNVIVRAAIHVDPTTAALTVVSDAFPQTLNGIPLQLRTVSVNINREGFVFNPTSCAPQAITATLSSSEGLTANVSSRFQAANCRGLAFHPTFTATTSGRPTKANGASLKVTVTSGPGQANIAYTRVALPIKLPSRLTTLQKACLAAVFEANPASCPAASLVGSARASTPVLKNPLSGPAYLVSHGSTKFPDLVIILQGENITLQLTGNTDIKHGITTSTFKTLPDAPITTFTLNLPQGPHSVLAAFGNLCQGTLNMPTQITAQNGATHNQTTHITPTNCPKHHTTRHKHHNHTKH